jgi:hypothetical protein
MELYTLFDQQYKPCFESVFRACGHVKGRNLQLFEYWQKAKARKEKFHITPYIFICNPTEIKPCPLRCRESLAINGSLMVLGRCLEALKCNQSAPPGAPQRIIPFR